MKRKKPDLNIQIRFFPSDPRFYPRSE